MSLDCPASTLRDARTMESHVSKQQEKHRLPAKKKKVRLRIRIEGDPAVHEVEVHPMTTADFAQTVMGKGRKRRA